MTTADDRPQPFLTVRVEDATGDYPLLGLCAGYERGYWRRKALGKWLFRHLLQFAFRFSELRNLNSVTADEMLREAAKRVYTATRFKGRGEFGELLLHAVLRSHFDSHSAASKIFYKSADNETVKGYDCVHVVEGEHGLELWFGEAKLYKDAGAAIRDAVGELVRHAGTEYLRREFALIQGKVEGRFADDIRRMTDPDVSLDEIFAVLRVPLLITYDSEVVDKHGEVSDEFKTELAEEIRMWHERFVEKSSELPPELHVHVILVPLKSKDELVAHLDSRLKDLQGPSSDEAEDDDLQKPAAAWTSAQFEQLKAQLRAEVIEQPFELLATVARAYTRADTAGDREARFRARDLVIRCIERADDLAAQRELLDALIARAGLFPYLDDPERLKLTDRLVFEAHRPLAQPADRELVFHGAQAEVYARLMDGDSVVLTAPTSFGKSVVIDALIASGRFDNVVVIVPTIALIDEARRRLTRASRTHKVITHGSQARADRNVFVMTQERVLEMDGAPVIDLLVVDEFYKLNLDQEGERSVLLNQAVYRLLRVARQFYLLGPNINELVPLPSRFKFFNIPSDDTTVAVDVMNVQVGDDKHAMLAELVCEKLDDQTLVYCSSPAKANQAAKTIVRALRHSGLTTRGDADAAEWVARTYHPDWTLVEALRHGVGIHHGRIPRALAHWMVTAFNDGTLRYLVCTQTLIEGVNTSAKHVVVFDNIRDRTPLDLFTFRNIQGRSGRMFRHFVGRVWLFGAPPSGELLNVDIPVLTQPDDTPPSLLLEVEDDERTEASRDRLSPYLTQDLVSIDALKANAGVPLDRQLKLAEELRDDASWAERLSWSNLLFPDYEAELVPALELVYRYFAPQQAWRRWGASSPEQMALLIGRLQRAYQPGQLIGDQFRFLARRSTPDPDEVVLSVLTFLRTAAGFAVPRYLRVVDTLARDVYGDPYRGDIRPFAAALEGFFLPQPLAALDEYGLPPEIARRFAGELAPSGASGSLDETLARLRRLPPDRVRGFERVLLKEAQRDL